MTKPVLSYTKAARIEREEARNAIYNQVFAMSHSERYMRGMVLRGMADRTTEQQLELVINNVVTNGYDSFSTADGCPGDVSDVLRGYWKVKARLDFVDKAAADPTMLAGYAKDTIAKLYRIDKERNRLMTIVAQQIAQLLQSTITSYCSVRSCDVREATGTELRTGILTDKWVMIKDDSDDSPTGLLIRPIAEYRRRVKGVATISGKAFMQAIYDETDYMKLFKPSGR